METLVEKWNSRVWAKEHYGMDHKGRDHLENSHKGKKLANLYLPIFGGI
jgi:hypothetical protein